VSHTLYLGSFLAVVPQLQHIRPSGRGGWHDELVDEGDVDEVSPAAGPCMVYGAWCISAWCMVHGAWCMSVWCSVQCAVCMVYGAWCIVYATVPAGPSIRFPGVGVLVDRIQVQKVGARS
jgi:hypothetical protein